MIFENLKIKKIIKMSFQNITRFLSNSVPDVCITNIVNTNNSKKYELGTNNIIEFLKLYCESVYLKNKKDNFFLAEVVTKEVPIIAKFLLKFDNLDEKPYGNKLIKNLITNVNDVIKKLFMVRNNDILCVVLESEIFKYDSCDCIMIHIQYPFCKTIKKYIDGEFRNYLLDNLSSSSIHKYFDIEPINSWEERIIKSTDYYPLYGSKIKEYNCELIYSKVFGLNSDSKLQEIELEDSGVLKFRDHTYFSNIGNPEDLDIIEEDTLDEADNDKIFSFIMLPIFLSINYCDNTLSRKGGRLTLSDSEEDYNDKENPTELELIKYFIGIMSQERFEEPFCLDIGKALYNISKVTACSSSNGLKENKLYWKNVLKEKNSKFDISKCDEMWYHETFTMKNTITYKTLAFYAREDNPTKFKEWHQKWCMHMLTKSLDLGDENLANSFYRCYFLDYYYCGGKIDTWFKFWNNKLNSIDTLELENKVTENFLSFYEKFRIHLCNEHHKTVEKDKKDGIEKNIEIVKKIIKKLNQHKYVKTLIGCCKKKFLINDFMEKIDKASHLLGTENCVIEMTDEEAYTRTGKPEDYITKSTTVPYRYDYNRSEGKMHPDVKITLKYLSEIFRNEELRNFVKLFLSSLLYGYNSEKKLFFLIGKTNCSKSIFQAILTQAFGDYCFSMSSDFFCTKKNGGGPNPELAQAKNRRIGISSEPSIEVNYDGATIKRLTGNDEFYARACYDNGGKISAQFTPLISCNDIPDISGMDGATKKRVSMIPFESQYFNEEDSEELGIPTDYIEQLKLGKFRMDMDFEVNYKYKIACGFLWLAVNSYSKYKKEGLKQTNYIKTYQDRYWSKNDPMVKFISEYLEKVYKKSVCNVCKNKQESPVDCVCKGTGLKKVINKTKSITPNQVWTYYKMFWASNNPNAKISGQQHFVNSMKSSDRLGDLSSDNKWYGWKIKEEL